MNHLGSSCSKHTWHSKSTTPIRSMVRRVFYSFHYLPDNWRASQIRKMGIIDGNPAANDNDWEAIKRIGDSAIRRWIDNQLIGRSCTVVLIGSGTAGRRWIDYEIETSWNKGKGLVGIHIHNLLDVNGRQSRKGRNPFETFTLNNGKTKLSSVVRTYDPPYADSKMAYGYIYRNLSAWIDEAVSTRSRL